MTEQTPDERARIIEDFTSLYFTSGCWEDTRWLGVQALKTPLDLWLYQEIVWRRRPDLIVETGTHAGGSALFLANVCDLVGHGTVITIDVLPGERPLHERIVYKQGSSTDPAVVEWVRAAAGRGRTMVVLDSDHREEHVLREMESYHELVTPGDYLIVEDTVIGNPVIPDHPPGPMQAVEKFLREHPTFSHDERCEKFLMSFNPKGYLRKSE